MDESMETNYDGVFIFGIPASVAFLPLSSLNPKLHGLLVYVGFVLRSLFLCAIAYRGRNLLEDEIFSPPCFGFAGWGSVCIPFLHDYSFRCRRYVSFLPMFVFFFSLAPESF